MLVRFAAHPTVRRLPLLQYRQASAEASELRPGDMVEMKGRVLEVVGREHKRTGARGQALIQVQLFTSRLDTSGGIKGCNFWQEKRREVQN